MVKTLSKREIDMDEDTIDAIDPNERIIALKKIQPGDLRDVVIKLRTLLSSCETAAYTLYSDFSEVGGGGLEAEAEKARRTLELASARTSSLLALLEKAPAYVASQRKKSRS